MPRWLSKLAPLLLAAPLAAQPPGVAQPGVRDVAALQAVVGGGELYLPRVR